MSSPSIEAGPAEGPGAGVVVREAALDDAPAVTEFLTRLYADPTLDTVARRPPPNLADEEDFIRRGLENDRAVILLAFARGRVVGMLDIFAWHRPEGRHCGRLGMSVAKTWRGRGVGRRLLERGLAEARSWPGFSRVELEVVPWNVAGIALYESVGFRHEGRRVGAMNLRGTPEDVLMMGLVW